MTILFTLESFASGGVTTVISQYAQILVDNKNKVIILGQKPNQEMNNLFHGCTIIAVGGKSGYGFDNKFKNLFYYVAALDYVYANFSVDYIHWSTTWPALYSLCHWKTWFRKRIVTFFGAYDLEIRSDLSPRLTSVGLLIFNLKNLFRKYAQFFTLLLTSRIITLSNYSKQQILDHFSYRLVEKIQIIPGYVNVSDNKIQIRRKNNPVFTILNFGRAETRKGVDLLLQAVKKILDRGINLRVIIASPVEFWCQGTQLKAYEELNLFLNVQFVHNITLQQRKTLLEKADLFIIPSRDLETFGMTIIESLSMGVPVVGTPIGAIPEILSHFDKRFICKTVDADAIAQKILWYINLPAKERIRLRIKAVKTCEKFYNQKTLQKLLLRVYNN